MHREAVTTQSTGHNHFPMGTITKNIDDNAVDAQDEEDDYMHKWLELLCQFVQWICCKTYQAFISSFGKPPFLSTGPNSF